MPTQAKEAKKKSCLNVTWNWKNPQAVNLKNRLSCNQQLPSSEYTFTANYIQGTDTKLQNMSTVRPDEVSGDITK